MSKILFVNKSTEVVDFVILKPEGTGNIINEGSDYSTYEYVGGVRLDVKMSPEPTPAIVQMPFRLDVSDGTFAVSIDGVVQPNSYTKDTFALAFADSTVIKVTDHGEASELGRFGIENIKVEGTVEVKFYDIERTWSIKPVTEGVTYLDRHNLNQGITLPALYSVSCVGAVNFANDLAIEPGSEMKVTNGKVSATATDGETLLSIIKNDMGIDAVELEDWPPAP